MRGMKIAVQITVHGRCSLTPMLFKGLPAFIAIAERVTDVFCSAWMDKRCESKGLGAPWYTKEGPLSASGWTQFSQEEKKTAIWSLIPV